MDIYEFDEHNEFDENYEPPISEYEVNTRLLDDVDQQIQKYNDDINRLFDDVIKPYIDSDQCCILDQLQHRDQFVELMYKTPIIQQLLITRKYLFDMVNV